MNTLLIAIGNPFRGDDGVAHEVLRRLGARQDLVSLSVHQLTPEFAPEVSRAERVFFIDADVEAEIPVVEPVAGVPIRSAPFAHSLTPPEIVALAERLYGFGGEAYLCRVPVYTFEGDSLSTLAYIAVERAVAGLEPLLAEEARLSCR